MESDPSKKASDLYGSRSCYEIHQSQDKGRYLVASHSIDKNQVVLQDRAYVVGPFTVSMPLCLNCHVSPLTLEQCDQIGTPLSNMWRSELL